MTRNGLCVCVQFSATRACAGAGGPTGAAGIPSCCAGGGPGSEGRDEMSGTKNYLNAYLLTYLKTHTLTQTVRLLTFRKQMQKPHVTTHTCVWTCTPPR